MITFMYGKKYYYIMKKTTACTLAELERTLETRVRNSRDPIAIVGGHYAIDQDCIPLVESDSAFGFFPLYTLDVACRLVHIGKELSKSLKLVLMVDDHSQMIDSHWYMGDVLDTRQRVERYFRPFSLPEAYVPVMRRHGLTERDISPSRFHPLAFQESKYREEFVRESGLDPGCAGEYRLILEDLASQGFRTVLSFLPLACQAPTCNSIGQYGAARYNPELTVIHVYLSSDQHNTSTEQLERKTVQMYGGIPTLSSTQCRK